MTPDETPEEPNADTPEVEADTEPKAEAKPAKAPRKAKAKAAEKAEESTDAESAEQPTVAELKASDAEEKQPDGQQATLKTPAKGKKAAKKAVVAEAAAPGGGAEAQDAAKAQDATKPTKRLARKAAASVKAKPTRRVVSAHARYVRTSARKARMVCGHIRGKSIEEARAILAFTPREVARDWSKLLESAVANAESNHELLEDDLIVREAFADEGPTIKRFRPRAMGRATPIRKRTSHLTITLTPRPEPGNTKKHG
jgi:ribosomal protein L22